MLLPIFFIYIRICLVSDIVVQELFSNCYLTFIPGEHHEESNLVVSVADPDRFGPNPDPTSENRPDRSKPDPDSSK
jgi:hypothetical protein